MESIVNSLNGAVRKSSYTWLVTGVAGFIGSNLLEALLQLEEQVVGVDNFSTGTRANLDDVLSGVQSAEDNFTFVEGDIRSLDTCRDVCEKADIVLHHGALGSVPRSIANPRASHTANVDGSLNMLVAARDADVERFVYASSSSVYGDDSALPKKEEQFGTPLSPYAVTKRVNELYAKIFQRHYGVETIGLRYFNVFGPRQNPEGPYAAVIPKWITETLNGERLTIYGDGKASRDFCYVANAVQANLRAALAQADATGQVYNIAIGERTTLNELHELITRKLQRHVDGTIPEEPVYDSARPGDIRHSEADITAASEQLGYSPTHTVTEGLDDTLDWYIKNYSPVTP